MRGKMDCFGLTNVGTAREENEDQFLLADLNKSMLVHQTSLSHEDHTRLFGGSQGKLLLVADGMGGHAAGKQASAIAVATLARYVLNTMSWFLRLRGEDEEDFKDELRAAVEECQKRVEVAASADARREDMGTTLTMAYLLWPRLYVVHAGDSRCYLMRGDRLEQVTKDHTLAQQLVDRGALAPREAEESRWSHVLWNCIGGGSHDVSVDVYKATLHFGDTLLLCTDGLTGQVSDAAIRDVLRRCGTAEEACRHLVSRAKKAGGPDNITAVVAYFREAQPAAEQARAHAAVGEDAGRVQRPARGSPEPVGAGRASS
jgi:PPM family protein phosphatase